MLRRLSVTVAAVAVALTAATLGPLSAHANTRSVNTTSCTTDIASVLGFGDSQTVGLAGIDGCHNQGSIIGNDDTQIVGTSNGAHSNSGTITGNGNTQTVCANTAALCYSNTVTATGNRNYQSFCANSTDAFADCYSNIVTAIGNSNGQSFCANTTGTAAKVAMTSCYSNTVTANGNRNNQSFCANLTGPHAVCNNNIVIADGNGNDQTVFDSYATITAVGNNNTETDFGQRKSSSPNAISVTGNADSVQLGAAHSPVVNDSVTIVGSQDTINDPLSNTDVLIVGSGIDVTCVTFTAGLVVLTASSADAAC
jgi:hypothetical protein